LPGDGRCGLAVATPARADADADFSNQLHAYGIYGQKDDNAWIGKVSCDEYPTPSRMITTTCTAGQILAAARDVDRATTSGT
jgi:hypothetical protein